MNAIELSALPEITEVLPTDKIYIFTNRNGEYEMNAITFNQLSAYLYSYDMIQKYNEKFKNLQQLSADFINFLDTTYPTGDYILNNYITVYDFSEETNNIITVQDALSIHLFEYATNDYVEYSKIKLYKEHEKMRVMALRDISKTALAYIDSSQD